MQAKNPSIPLAFALTLALALGLTLALLWLLDGKPPVAQAQDPDGYDTYHVALSCTGVPTPCFTAVQAAVDATDAPDDVIKVAAGTYTGVQGRPAPAGYEGPSVITQVVYISKAITIRGGYTTTNWTTPDPVANPTTLDAQGNGRVLFISGAPSAGSGQAISPTVEGLRITGGDAAGLRGSSWMDVGGGVYVIAATATISDNRVFSNIAPGGGLYLSNSNATLNNNTVISNTASRGGGLYLFRSAAALNGNIIANNTAEYGGGGLSLTYSDAILDGNDIVANIASSRVSSL